MILWAFVEVTIFANAYFIFIEPKQSDVLKSLSLSMSIGDQLILG